MHDYLLTTESFSLQQNNHKSLTFTHVVETPSVKFFALFEIEKCFHHEYKGEIIESLEAAYKNIIKNSSIEEDQLGKIFEHCTKDFNRALVDLVHIRNLHLNLKKITGLIGVVMGNDLIVAYTGAPDGYLLYKTKDASYKLTTILQACPHAAENGADPINVFECVIQGELNPTQPVLFSSPTVRKYLTEYKIKQLLINKDHVAKTIENTLKQTTNNDNFAGVLFLPQKKSQIKTVKTLGPDHNVHQKDSVKILEKKKDQTKNLLEPTFYTVALQYIKRATLPLQRYVKDRFYQEPAVVEHNKKAQKDAIYSTNKVGMSILTALRDKDWKAAFVSLWRKIQILRQKVPMRTQIISLTIATLLVVLGTSIHFISTSREAKAQIAQYEATSEQLKENLLQAESSVIKKANSRAKMHLDEAKKLLDELKQYPKEYQSLPLAELEASIVEFEDQVMKITRIDTPNMSADLSATVSSPLRGVVRGEKLFYAYENSPKEILITNLSSSTTDAISLPNLVNTKITESTFFPNDSNSIYLLTAKNALLRLEPRTTSITSEPFEPIDDTITGLASYNSNLYILYPEINQIYKYRKVQNGFNKPKKWVTDGSAINQAVDIYINGTVHLLSKNGKIDQLFGGQYNGTTIKPEVDPAIENAKSFAYSESRDTYYILDAENNRIIAITDKNELIAQYLVKDLNNMADVVLSNDENTLFILNDSSVYTIKL